MDRGALQLQHCARSLRVRNSNVPERLFELEERCLSSLSPLGARLARGMFWCLLGGGISRSMSLAATILAARALGREDFGALGMIQSTVMVSGVVAEMGLNLTVTKHVAEYRQRDPARAARILRLAFWLTALTGIVVAAALAASAPLMAHEVLRAPQITPEVRVAAGLVAWHAINGVQTAALAGLEAFRAVAVVSLLGGVCSSCGLAVGAVAGGLNGAVWGLNGGLLLMAAINHVALRRELRKAGVPAAGGPCLREWRVVLGFGAGAFLATLLYGGTDWAVNALLARRPGGYAELAALSIGRTWLAVVMFLPAAASQNAIPMLSNLRAAGDAAGYNRVLGTNALVLALLGALSAAGVILLAAPILRLYGLKYAGQEPILVLMAFAGALMAANLVFGHALWSLGAVGISLAGLIVRSGLLLGATWCFLNGGARGVAWAILVANLLFTVVQFTVTNLVVTRMLPAREAGGEQRRSAVRGL